METWNPYKKISWSVVFAAALIGLGLNFLFNLFLLAIGLTIFVLSPENKVVFSVLSFIGFACIAIIVMFTTGWMAGKTSPPYYTKRIWAIYPGFVTWSLLLVLTIILLMNMIQFVSFHSNFTSKPNLVGIKIINNYPMLTESKNISASTFKPSDIEKETKIITLNATVSFLLFLIGASACSFGAYVGYSKDKLIEAKKILTY